MNVMANNETKTNAEIYREQRKARLAKEAKKKSSPGRDKAVRIAVKAVVIVLAAAIVLTGLAKVLTNVFYIPQKILTVATYDGQKLSAAEFNYYYLYQYNSLYQTAQYYDQQYGQGYGSYFTGGFDYTKSPAEQEYTGQDAPEGVKTFADYFAATTPATAFNFEKAYKLALSDEAKEAGFTYSEENLKSEVEQTITQIETSAKQADFSVNQYIAKYAGGEGMTEKTYKAQIEKDYIAREYLNWLRTSSAANLSDKEVKAYYEEHKDTYDKATARLYGFSYAKPAEDAENAAPAYSKAEAKKLANEFLSKITDSNSFVSLAHTYAPDEQKEQYEDSSATLLKNQSKEAISGGAAKLADWMFDSSRKAGDKAVINDSESEMFYVAFIVTPAAPDKSYSGVSVRHILVEAATTDEDGEKLKQEQIDKNFAEAKKEANAILAEYKKGDKTDDSFAALATEKTDDPGSKETGGLYSGINSDSSFVEPFLTWAMDSHKVGDTGIVKTSYGYHVMYYVGAEDKTEKWVTDIKAAVSEEKYSTFSEETYAEIEENIDINRTLVDYFSDRIVKTYFAG